MPFFFDYALVLVYRRGKFLFEGEELIDKKRDKKRDKKASGKTPRFPLRKCPENWKFLAVPIFHFSLS